MAEVNKTVIYFGKTPQMQSDWGENDNSKVTFIKNKPTIPTVINIEGSVSDSVFTPDDEISASEYGEIANAFVNGAIVRLCFDVTEEGVDGFQGIVCIPVSNYGVRGAGTQHSLEGVLCTSNSAHTVIKWNEPETSDNNQGE